MMQYEKSISPELIKITLWDGLMTQIDCLQENTILPDAGIERNNNSEPGLKFSQQAI